MIKARYQKMYTEKYKQDMDFVIIGDHYIGPFVDMDVAQKAVSAINKQFAPKPRTRTEYEKVTESIFDLRDEFERGELYCKHEHARECTQITNTQTLAQALHGGYCYRLVEKEIDERQEFIERAKDLIDASKDADYSLGNMYDAGCRFQD